MSVASGVPIRAQRQGPAPRRRGPEPVRRSLTTAPALCSSQGRPVGSRRLAPRGAMAHVGKSGGEVDLRLPRSRIRRLAITPDTGDGPGCMTGAGWLRPWRRLIICPSVVRRRLVRSAGRGRSLRPFLTHSIHQPFVVSTAKFSQGQTRQPGRAPRPKLRSADPRRHLLNGSAQWIRV